MCRLRRGGPLSLDGCLIADCLPEWWAIPSLDCRANVDRVSVLTPLSTLPCWVRVLSALVFLVSLPLTPRAHCSYVGEARICFSVSATVIASPHGGFFRLEEGSKIILPSVAAQQRMRGINIFPDSEAQGLASLYHHF